MSKVYKIDKNKISSLFVLGDTHGDFPSLENLLSKAEKDEKIITLGDYTDRGPQGAEVIARICILWRESKKLIPLKGNHEDYNENGEPNFSPCTLPEEINKKFNSKGTNWNTYFKFDYQPFIKHLYIAAILPGELLFVHGGICDNIKTKSDIEKYERFILWSDPSSSKGMGKSGRPKFGPDVSKKVCEALGVKRIIRSHQPDKAGTGPYEEHDGRIVTTCSTTCYGGKPSALRISTDKPQEYEVIF